MAKNRSPTLDYTISQDKINIYNPRNKIPLTTKIFFLDNSYKLMKVPWVRCMYGSLDDFRLYKYNKGYYLHSGGEVVGRENHNKNFVVGKIVEYDVLNIDQVLYFVKAFNDSKGLTNQTMAVADIISFDSPEELYKMHFTIKEQLRCYVFPLNIMNETAQKIIRTKHNRVRVNGFKEILEDFDEIKD